MRGRTVFILATSLSGVVAALAACSHDYSAVDTADADAEAASPDSAVAVVDATTVDTDAAASTDGADASDATIDGGSDSLACVAYCNSFSAHCMFSATSTDIYPSPSVCLRMCARLPTTDNVDLDDLACRLGYLDGSAPDCPAAGPWGFDPDTGAICYTPGGGQPCTSICRMMAPRCYDDDAGADASLDDCTTFCTALVINGNSSRSCAESNTLAAYSAATREDISAACNAFKACPTN